MPISRMDYPEELIDNLCERDQILYKNRLLRSRSIITAKCSLCNKEFTQRFGNYTQGKHSGICPKCARKLGFEKNRLNLFKNRRRGKDKKEEPNSPSMVLLMANNHNIKRNYPEELIDKIEKNDKVKFLNGEISIKEYTNIKCNIHDIVYKQRICNLLIGHIGCPKCKAIASNRCQVKSNYPERFMNDLHPEDRIRVENKELSMINYARFYCKKHGYFRQQLGAHLNSIINKHTNGCRECAKGSQRSSIEIELEELFKTDFPNINLINSAQLFKNSQKHIDIYLPDYKIGFEFNGLRYHGIGKNIPMNKYKPEDYHYQKYLLAKEANITLYQLWEDTYKTKLQQEYTYKFILSKLDLLPQTSIDINLCQVIKPSNNQYNLTYNDITLASIQVSYSAITNSYTLSNYITNIDYNILNCFSYLLSYIENNLNIKEYQVISQNDYPQDKLFLSNGFKEVECLPPQSYSIFYKNKRVSKDKFFTSKLKQQLSNQNLSEFDYIDQNDLWRTYDSGITIFKKI